MLVEIAGFRILEQNPFTIITITIIIVTIITTILITIMTIKFTIITITIIIITTILITIMTISYNVPHDPYVNPGSPGVAAFETLGRAAQPGKPPRRPWNF